jgi:hypothetical protein
MHLTANGARVPRALAQRISTFSRMAVSRGSVNVVGVTAENSSAPSRSGLEREKRPEPSHSCGWIAQHTRRAASSFLISPSSIGWRTASPYLEVHGEPRRFFNAHWDHEPRASVLDCGAIAPLSHVALYLNVLFPCPGKSGAIAHALQNLAEFRGHRRGASVLDCVSPPPLSDTPRPWKSARGLARSKPRGQRKVHGKKALFYLIPLLGPLPVVRKEDDTALDVALACASGRKSACGTRRSRRTTGA